MGEMDKIREIGLENLTNEVEGDLSVGADLKKFTETVSRLYRQARRIKHKLGGQRSLL